MPYTGEQELMRIFSALSRGNVLLYRSTITLLTNGKEDLPDLRVARAAKICLNQHGGNPLVQRTLSVTWVLLGGGGVSSSNGMKKV